MVTAIYIAAALIPAFILMNYIYKKDKADQEPPRLLLKLAVYGCWAALLASLIETGNDLILTATGTSENMILLAITVGLAEEFSKLLFLKKGSWDDHNFNYLFDGVVYAVFVSLGFAGLENVIYVFSYGLSVALPRALLSVPGHMCFGVFMGVFYGRAKRCDIYGDESGRKKNLILAFILPVFFHSFFDACAMSENDTALMVFAVFIVVMYIIVYRLIKAGSMKDEEF